jgi:PKD repeat protein
VKKTITLLIALWMSVFSFGQTTILFPGHGNMTVAYESGTFVKTVTASSNLPTSLTNVGDSDNIVVGGQVVNATTLLHSNSLTVLRLDMDWSGQVANFSATNLVYNQPSDLNVVFTDIYENELDIAFDSLLVVNSTIHGGYLTGVHPTIVGASLYDTGSTVKAVITTKGFSGNVTFVAWKMVTNEIIAELEGDLPDADFYANETSIDVGERTDFFDDSSEDPHTWSWEFAGGYPSTSSVQNPQNIRYDAPGDYMVKLTVWNDDGSDFEIKYNYIHVADTGNKLIANFYATPTTLFEGDATQFHNTSEGNPTGQTWYFPGGTPDMSTDFNPEIVYNESGDYDVSLFIYDNQGNTADTVKYDYIHVQPSIAPPIANFTANDTIIYVGDVVDYTDLSLNDPTSWLWIFGGGTPLTSILKDPSIQYNTPGKFPTSLTVWNVAGSNTKLELGYITVLDTAAVDTIPPHLIWHNTVINGNIAMIVYSSSEGGDLALSTGYSSQTDTTEMGPNILVLDPESVGIHDDLSLFVTDTAGNIGTLDVPPFEIESVIVTDTIPPCLSWVKTTVDGNIATIEYTSTESGDLSLSSGYSSQTNTTTADSNALALDPLANGIYNDLSLFVTDTAGNMGTLHVPEFIILEVIPDTIKLIDRDMWTWFVDPKIAYPNENVEHEYEFNMLPDSIDDVRINGNKTTLSWGGGTTFNGNFSVPDSMATGYIQVYLSVWKDGINVTYTFTSDVFVKGYDNFPKFVRLMGEHRFIPSPQGGNVYQATEGDRVLLEFRGPKPKSVTMIGRSLTPFLNHEELWVVETYIDEWDIDHNEFVDFIVEYENGNVFKSTTDESSIKLIPLEQNLLQNSPNPVFSGNPTKITFELEERSDVLLEVFDMSGRKKETLLVSKLEAGSHSITYTSYESGTFLYCLTTTVKGKVVTRKAKKMIVQR